MRKDENKPLSEDIIRIALDRLERIYQDFERVKSDEMREFYLKHAVEDATKLICVDSGLLYHPTIQNIISLSLQEKRFGLLKRYLYKRIKEPLEDKNRFYPFFPAWTIFRKCLRKTQVRKDGKVYLEFDLSRESQKQAIKSVASICRLDEEMTKKLIYEPDKTLHGTLSPKTTTQSMWEQTAHLLSWIWTRTETLICL